MSKRNREENLLKSFIRSVGLDSLPNFQKFNIAASFVLLLLVFILNSQPIMMFVNNIATNICNTIIIISTGDKQNLLETNINSSATAAIIIGVLFLCAEVISCTIFCYKAKEKNKEQKQTDKEEKDDIKLVQKR